MSGGFYAARDGTFPRETQRARWVCCLALWQGEPNGFVVFVARDQDLARRA
jgi:hypothetical protein